MISKGNNKTAAEKRWHETVAEWVDWSIWTIDVYGTRNGISYCKHPMQVQFDHFLGAQAKRKVNLISVKVGEWAINPIPIELHDVMYKDKQYHRDGDKRRFEDTFGTSKQLFKRMVETMKQDGIEIPFSDEILNAIVYG